MNWLIALVAWITANAALVSVLLGVVTTLVVGFFTTCQWTPIAKTWAAIVVAVILGFVQAALSNTLDLTTSVAVLLSVYGASQAFYLAVLKPLGINVWFLEKFGVVSRK